MSESKQQRKAVANMVECERLSMSLHALEEAAIREDPVRHAIDWGERMAAEIKYFGDGHDGRQIYRLHFVFDSAQEHMDEFNAVAHAVFRDLLGVTFKPLTQKRTVQKEFGNALLHGWGRIESGDQLELAWYEAVRLGAGPTAISTVAPVEQSALPTEAAEA